MSLIVPQRRLTAAQVQANLAALSSQKTDFDRVRAQEGEAWKSTHRSQSTGGVRLVGVVINVFKPKDTKGPVYSVNFEVLLFQVAAALREGEEKFVKTDPKTNTKFVQLDLPDYKPPSTNPPPVSPELQQMAPKTCSFHSFKTIAMSLPVADASTLKALTPNDIIYFNGVSGRLAVIRSKDIEGKMIPGTERWAVFYQAGSVEKTGLTMGHLWNAAKDIPSSHFAANDKMYNPMDPSTRYARETSYWISHTPTPAINDKAGREAYNLATAANCCSSVLDSASLRQDKSLYADAAPDDETLPKEPTRPCARLTYSHMQWPQDQTLTADNKQYVSIGVTAFHEMLAVFGIASTEMWKALAPRILEKMSCKWHGYVDTKGSIAQFGGIAQSNYDFGLQIIPTAVIPDVKSVCQQIGIRVTAEYVEKFMQKPGTVTGPVNRETTRLSRPQVLARLPPVVPINGEKANPTVSHHLIYMGTKTKTPPEFYALINFSVSPQAYKLVRSLTPEQGSLIVEAFVTNNTVAESESEDADMLASVLDALDVGEGYRCCIIQAVCDKVVPPNDMRANEKLLRKFILGVDADVNDQIEDSASASASAAASLPALASGSTVSITAVESDADDDDEAGSDGEDSLFGDDGKQEEEDDTAPSTSSSSSAAAAAAAAAAAVDPVSTPTKKVAKRKIGKVKDTKSKKARAEA